MSTATDTAYDAIRQRIALGDYPAGARLREEELGAELGVSRTPIREALRRLGAEGFVVYESNRGVRVASWTDEELAEIFELRALLESYAARLAATRASGEVVTRLGELATEMDKLLDESSDAAMDQIAQLNNDFHMTVLSASGSPHLMQLCTTIIQTPLVHRTFRRYSHEALARSFAHHREIVAALANRDGSWAESVMRAHIRAARHVFDADDEGGDKAGT